MFLYKHEEIGESKSNILFQVVGCIHTGVKYKVKKMRDDLSTDCTWIDGSLQQYPESFVNEVCEVLKVFVSFNLLFSRLMQSFMHLKILFVKL